MTGTREIHAQNAWTGNECAKSHREKARARCITLHETLHIVHAPAFIPPTPPPTHAICASLQV